MSASLDRKVQYLASLSDNWNGEGSQACDPATVRRARDAIPTIIRRMSEISCVELGEPALGARPDGSIDISWESPNGLYAVLATVPHSPKKRIPYFATVHTKEYEGTL